MLCVAAMMFLLEQRLLLQSVAVYVFSSECHLQDIRTCACCSVLQWWCFCLSSVCCCNVFSVCVLFRTSSRRHSRWHLLQLESGCVIVCCSDSFSCELHLLLQCVAVYVLLSKWPLEDITARVCWQCVCCSVVLSSGQHIVWQCVAVCCSSVAVCCSVLQSVAVCCSEFCSVLQNSSGIYKTAHGFAVYHSIVLASRRR